MLFRSTVPSALGAEPTARVRAPWVTGFVFAGLGWQVASRVLRFDPTTVRDGLTSVRRGFSVESLGRLLRTAGLDAPVSRRPGARLVAVWRPAS